MNHNYIPFIDTPGGPTDNRHQPRQTSQSARTNNHFFESCTTFPRSKVDRFNSSSCEVPSSMRTVSSLTIPDIRLEPPSENLVLDTVFDDIHEDMRAKMDEILGRLQLVDPEDVGQAGDLVALPGRYTRRLLWARETVRSPGREFSPVDEDMRTRETGRSPGREFSPVEENMRTRETGRSPGREFSPVDEDMRTRETDLGTALKWIRQEILHMKQQDRCLLRQFAHLHESILQLRGIYDAHGSCSDVSSLDGSTYSLNEQARSPRLRRLVLDGSYTSKPSVSLPSSPRVSRFKWGSQDIG